MPAGEPDYIDDDLITMSDSRNWHTYVLHSTADEYSCIDSLKVYGGPTQPFEYIVVSISKKRLTTLAPLLVNDVFAGLNVISIYGFGRDGAQYTVTNCKKSGGTWKITAYSLTEQIRAFTLSNISYIQGASTPSGFSAANKNLIGSSPSSTIAYIIDNQQSSALRFADGTSSRKYINHTYMAFKRIRSYDIVTILNVQIKVPVYTDVFENPVEFSSGTSVWRVLSLCAMKLGCSIWVDGDTLYVVDLSLDDSSNVTIIQDGQTVSNQTIFENIGTIYLNTEGQYPYATTYTQDNIINNVVGLPSPEQEGRNFVRNKVVITINESKDTLTNKVVDQNNNEVFRKGQVISNTYVGSSFEYTEPGAQTPTTYNHVVVRESDEIKQSKTLYGIIQYELDIPELYRPDAQDIADNIVQKYCDSEQPISFTMREIVILQESNQTRAVWTPAFSRLTRADKIFDYSNDLLLSNTSNLLTGQIRPEKCALTGWVRNFPEHTTTYTFGEIAPTDMTQNDSIIKSALASKSM